MENYQTIQINLLNIDKLNFNIEGSAGLILNRFRLAYAGK